MRFCGIYAVKGTYPKVIYLSLKIKFISRLRLATRRALKFFENMKLVPKGVEMLLSGLAFFSGTAVLAFFLTLLALNKDGLAL